MFKLNLFLSNSMFIKSKIIIIFSFICIMSSSTGAMLKPIQNKTLILPPIILQKNSFAIHKKKPSLTLSYGNATKQGINHKLSEDNSYISFISNNPLKLFALYDGHGGGEASSIAAFNSFYIEQFYAKTNCSTEQAIFQGLLQIDQEIKQTVSNQGCTAAVCGIEPDKKMATIATSGDSRILVARSDGSIRYQTTDHTASNPTEIERIRSFGGDVYYDGKTYRHGGFVPTRGLGDYVTEEIITTLRLSILNNLRKKEALILQDLATLEDQPYTRDVELTAKSWHKELRKIIKNIVHVTKSFAINEKNQIVGRTNEPVISSISLYPDDACIIIASDGLWDIAKSPMIASWLAAKYLENTNAPLAAQELCDWAHTTYKGADDVTIIIIFLHWS